MKIKLSRIIITIIFFIVLSFIQGAQCCTRHPLLISVGARCRTISGSSVIAHEGVDYCICALCRSGDYLDSTKLECCRGSIPNCFTCLGNGAGGCAHCMPTFTSSGGLCASCSVQTGCKYCSNINTCDVCVDTNYYLDVGQKCALCSSGTIGIPFCSKCTFLVGIICSECQDNTRLLLNNTCLSCGDFIENCYSCVSTTSCTQCQTLY